MIETLERVLDSLDRVEQGVDRLHLRAETNSDLAAAVMVKGQNMKETLQNILNIAKAPFMIVCEPEHAYEVAMARLNKIAELSQALLDAQVKTGDFTLSVKRKIAGCESCDSDSPCPYHTVVSG